eukprot:6184943-Pleurochrysis_carterae.AAC.1
MLYASNAKWSIHVEALVQGKVMLVVCQTLIRRTASASAFGPWDFAAEDPPDRCRVALLDTTPCVTPCARYTSDCPAVRPCSKPHVLDQCPADVGWVETPPESGTAVSDIVRAKQRGARVTFLRPRR